jgi:hypothetical protein
LSVPLPLFGDQERQGRRSHLVDEGRHSLNLTLNPLSAMQQGSLFQGLPTPRVARVSSRS